MQRFTLIGLSVATTVLVALAFVLAVAAAGSASTKPTHFAGFPPEDVKASTPTTGRLLIGLRPTETTTWNVYSNGRVIWQKWTSFGDATVVPDGARRLDTGYVQQRLTPAGVQLLLSKILATGLFENSLTLDLWRGHASVFHQVRRGDRMVTVNGVPSPDRADPRDFTKATPAQTRALAWIEKLVASPARWLPTRAWANRQNLAFVPARYVVGFDRDYPDISKLPPPAGKALAQYKPLKRRGCQILTTWKARALLQAFVEAGLSPSENHALTIAFAFAGLHSPFSDFHMSPALPDNDRC
jgi:hypothetical protein